MPKDMGGLPGVGDKTLEKLQPEEIAQLKLKDKPNREKKKRDIDKKVKRQIEAL